MPETRGSTVSVVIPTRNRPQMVLAAVESALAEPVAEVIVIIDGPEETPGATRSVLEGVADPRLRLLVQEHSVGGAEARNVGVRAAMGTWIGFLDDDDLWMARKITTQLEFAARLSAKWPVLSCAVIARSPTVDRVWPRRLYRPPEPMSEYLFCRAGWTYGAGLLQTSTLLVPKELMERVPFTSGLKKHQDWDWLLRVAAEPDVRIAMVREPLVVFHVEGQRSSVGRGADWLFSSRWAIENRRLFTRKAFASFIATECAPQAGRSGASLAERSRLVGELFTDGLPSIKTLALCLGFLLVPQQVRRGFRNAALSLRRA